MEWRCLGEASELTSGKRSVCKHVFAESGKSDDLVLVHHKGAWYCLGAWCGHMGE